jgi:hypothetical protein
MTHTTRCSADATKLLPNVTSQLLMLDTRTVVLLLLPGAHAAAAAASIHQHLSAAGGSKRPLPQPLPPSVFPSCLLRRSYTLSIARMAPCSPPAANTAALRHNSSLQLMPEASVVVLLLLLACMLQRLQIAHQPYAAGRWQQLAAASTPSIQCPPVLYAAALLHPHHHAHSAAQRACCHHCCLATQ